MPSLAVGQLHANTGGTHRTGLIDEPEKRGGSGPEKYCFARQSKFYAGAQLTLPGGEKIGTLCLIDRVPRQLDDIDLAILGTLRDLAMEELLRRTGESAP